VLRGRRLGRGVVGRRILRGGGGFSGVVAVSAARRRHRSGGAGGELVVNLLRLLKHVVTPSWIAHRPFTPGVCRRSNRHPRLGTAARRRAAVRVEARLPLHYLFSKKDIRESRGLFAQLGVWDTGTIAASDLRAARGPQDRDRRRPRISSKVAQVEWAAICRHGKSFKGREFAEGALQAIERITALLAKHFPAFGREPRRAAGQAL